MPGKDDKVLEPMASAEESDCVREGVKASTLSEPVEDAELAAFAPAEPVEPTESDGSAEGGLDASIATGLDDEELTSLFSAFGQVSASTELKSATIAAILGGSGKQDGLAADVRESESDVVDLARGGAPASENRAASKQSLDAKAAPSDPGLYPTEQATPSNYVAIRGGSAQESDAGAQSESAESAPAATGGTRTGGSRMRARLRAIRVAALAACLALALTGGVAYAVPASHVTVTQGDTSVDLGINVFGVTVSAETAGDDGDWVDVGSLKNLSGEDAMDRAAAMLGERDGAQPIDVSVASGFEDQARRFEDRGAQIVRDQEQRMRESVGEAPGFEDVPVGEGGMPGETWDEAAPDRAEDAPNGEEGFDGRNRPGEGELGEDAEGQDLPDDANVPSGRGDVVDAGEPSAGQGEGSPNGSVGRDDAELQDREPAPQGSGTEGAPSETSAAPESAAPTPDSPDSDVSRASSPSPEHPGDVAREATYENDSPSAFGAPSGGSAGVSSGASPGKSGNAPAR